MPPIPRKTEAPKKPLAKQEGMLRAYIAHGIDLEEIAGSKEALGDCPFCGKEQKLSVNKETGQWQCWSCREGTDKGGGNAITFIRRLWKLSDERTQDYKDLGNERKFLNHETLMHWGACRSLITGKWLLPGYNADGKLSQLYRYLKVLHKGKWVNRLLPTPGLDKSHDGKNRSGHGIYGLPLFDPKKDTILVAEGPWDGMALWEVMRSAKRVGDKLVFTASESDNILAEANVIAVPGCGSIGSPLEKWAPLFAGKKVYLLFDSDHPTEINGKTIPPAGHEAMRRASLILSASNHPPTEISYLHWGDSGFNPTKKSGYDLRDLLSEGGAIAGRLTALSSLLSSSIREVPSEWRDTKGKVIRVDSTDAGCLYCDSWSELINSWRKAMRWTEGLDRGLSVMFACILSTEAVGDQLWCRAIGPPSSGKSTLCEALSVNRDYIYPKDTFTGLISGYQTDKDGENNLSMVLKIKNKTLVINDGDTILQLPSRDQVLSQLRAFYGRNIRSQYGNKMTADHEGINATLILCGTEDLRALNSSSLGERFVDVVIADKIDEDEERQTALRIAYRAAREMNLVSDGSNESRDGPEMVKAKQLTGGYVSYLRLNAQRLLEEVGETEEAMLQCVDLGTFIAYMRARPSAKQEEVAQREMSYRLTSQMVRLGKALAVVLNKKEMDTEVMRRVRAVALDTARGHTMYLVKCIHREGLFGISLGALAIITNRTEDKERIILQFLANIGIAEKYNRKGQTGLGARYYWRLTEHFKTLYERVMGHA